MSGRPAKPTLESSGFIAVDGVRLSYRERGSGVPGVLIHGTGANADCWGDCFVEMAAGAASTFSRRPPGGRWTTLNRRSASWA